MNSSFSSIVLSLLVIVVVVELIHGALKFHSMSCTSLAEDTVHFDECRIKAIDRTHNAISVRARIKKTLSNIRVHIKIVKRERGGWHPFLYELSFDVCKFFACRARYPVPNLVFYYMQNYTNYNRSCILAANSSLNLLDWRIDEGKFLDRTPLELGIYGMNTVWYSKKKQVFFTNGSLNLF